MEAAKVGTAFQLGSPGEHQAEISILLNARFGPDDNLKRGRISSRSHSAVTGQTAW